MTKTNGKIKLIGLIITLVVLGTGVVANFAVSGKDIEINRSENVELKTEGCLPARKNTIDIAVITGQLDTIQTENEAIKADTKEILSRLPK